MHIYTRVNGHGNGFFSQRWSFFEDYYWLISALSTNLMWGAQSPLSPRFRAAHHAPLLNYYRPFRHQNDANIFQLFWLHRRLLRVIIVFKIGRRWRIQLCENLRKSVGRHISWMEAPVVQDWHQHHSLAMHMEYITWPYTSWSNTGQLRFETGPGRATLTLLNPIGTADRIGISVGAKACTLPPSLTGTELWNV